MGPAKKAHPYQPVTSQNRVASCEVPFFALLPIVALRSHHFSSSLAYCISTSLFVRQSRGQIPAEFVH
jgi:hypothetical protein